MIDVFDIISFLRVTETVTLQFLRTEQGIACMSAIIIPCVLLTIAKAMFDLTLDEEKFTK